MTAAAAAAAAAPLPPHYTYCMQNVKTSNDLILRRFNISYF